jgi:hypothetical protein
MKHKPLPHATVVHLNHIIRECQERIKQRDAELDAIYASQGLAVAVEMARDA